MCIGDYTVTTVLCVWTLLWFCCATDITDVPCPVSDNSTTEGSPQFDKRDKDNRTMGSRDVVKLIGLLGWTSVTVLYDSQSEKSAEQLVLDSGIQLQGVHFVKYNTDAWLDGSDIDTLLQHVHSQFYPRLNFVLIGREDIVVRVISKVSSHDSKYNRTTDFQHSSRWIAVTSIDPHLTQTLYPFVDGHLDHVVVMCSRGDEGAAAQTNTAVRSNNDFNILTWSRSSNPPKFVKVSVTSSMDRVSLLDAVYPNVKYSYNERTFVVSTLMWSPFTMKRDEAGTVVYEGYCFEVLNLIAQALNFSVQLVAPSDGEWGLEKNGSWTGLVGQLQYREVDMVVAPLTMHEDREKVMDFILPAFYSENVDILYRRQDRTSDDIYVVLKPYKAKVLVCIAASVVVVVVIIFYLEQWVPHQTETDSNSTGVHNDAGGRRHRIRSFVAKIICPRKDIADHIYMTFWRILGTLFRQSGSWDPVRSSTRVLLSGWWLLTLVLSAGYSAYLVASLAVTINSKPFKTLQDVVDSTDYKLGIMSTGIIKLIFEKSKREDFKQAWNKVVQLNGTDPGVLAGTESAHVQKVLNGKYCWIIDVTTAQKSLRLDCDLATVGVRLNGQQLAIGVPTGSPLKPALEQAMSSIADSGLLGKWWRRWQKTRTPEMCPKPPSIRPISRMVIMGPISVAAVGIGAAGLALVLEIVKHKYFGHAVRS